MRIVGYGRVSTQLQNEKGTSKEEQHDRIEKECEHKNHELVEFYFDGGFSGKNKENRPSLQRMINDAKVKKFDGIMFTRLDRFARNLSDLLDLWKILQDENKVDLICLDIPWLDTSDHTGKLMLQVVGAFAEFERSTIKSRFKEGRMSSWKNGKCHLGSLPFGYKWNKELGVIEKDEAQKQIYNSVVRMYLDQHFPMLDIADKLNQEGVLTKSKRGTWSRSVISKILRNPAYAGVVYYNQHKFKAPTAIKNYSHKTGEIKSKEDWIRKEFPPLLSEEKWKAIQARIENQKIKPKKRHKGLEEKFLCENVLRCGECGSKVKKYANPLATGGFSCFYACYWRVVSKKEIKGSGKKKCALPIVSSDNIDDAVFHEVVQIISNPILQAEKWLKKFDVGDLKAKQKSLRKRKDTLERQIKKILKSDFLRDEAISYIVEGELEEAKGSLVQVQSNLLRVEADIEASTSRFARLKEFEKEVHKKTVREKIRKGFKKKYDIEKYLWNLPQEKKKRIVEAIVAPELGGKCVIRYLLVGDIGSDASHDEAMKARTDLEPIVELDCQLDVERLEAVISSLNQEKLLDCVVS